jgi:hypothetical protein
MPDLLWCDAITCSVSGVPVPEVNLLDELDDLIAAASKLYVLLSQTAGL